MKADLSVKLRWRIAVLVLALFCDPGNLCRSENIVGPRMPAVSGRIWAQSADIMNAINLSEWWFRDNLCDVTRVQWFHIRGKIAELCDGHDDVWLETFKPESIIFGSCYKRSEFRASFLVYHFPSRLRNPEIVMDFDLLSSPPAPRSSLPPSSAPNLSQSANGRSPRRPVADVLTIGDDEPQDDDSGGDAAGRRRRRAKGQPVGDVPLVKDPVGESVAESFESFLNTYVSCYFRAIQIIIRYQLYRRCSPCTNSKL